MKNAKSILMTTAIAALMLVGGCNGNQQNEHGDHDHEMMDPEKEHNHSNMEEHQNGMSHEKNVQQENHEHQMSNQGGIGEYAVGDQVPSIQVCMVNDAYMAKDQIPVPVNGKTYYGCCQMCVKTLNEQETARIAIDPQTNEKVDKTEAYIVLLDKEGTVGYFKNKANAEAYANN